eukprot:3200260-Amphidinium_carterae.1
MVLVVGSVFSVVCIEPRIRVQDAPMDRGAGGEGASQPLYPLLREPARPKKSFGKKKMVSNHTVMTPPTP